MDSENEASEDGPKPAKPPAWRKIQDELAAAGVATGPVKLTDEALAKVFTVVARHDLVLATGHLGRAEIHAVVDAALAAGVKHVVVTHPDYPTQGVPVDEQRELAERGAMLERCFAPIHSGKVSWEQTFDAIRATGAERNVLSTDLGQVQNPPVEDGLALMADRLLEAGFSEDDVRTMAVTNTTDARRCLERCSSSVRTPPTSSGARQARSRASSRTAGRRTSSRSRTASAASRASSGRSRARPRSA